MDSRDYKKHIATISAVLLSCFFPNLGAHAESASALAEVKEAPQQLQERKKIDEHLNSLVKHRRTRAGWLGNGELPQNVKLIKDIPYVHNGSKSQSLDLYLPQQNDEASARGPVPLIIWIHGGGWRGGDKKGGPMRALLNAGFAVASINYRLSTEAKWPAQLDDCQSAVNFLEAHSSEYGTDAKKVALWGASAGGHLVLMLALKSGTAHGIKAVCDWFGPTDLVSYIQSKRTTPNGMEMIRQLLQTDDAGLLSAAKDASPMTFIKKETSLPALLIVHGKQDPLVPVEQSEKLAKQLVDLGFANVTLSVIKGGHGYPGFGSDTIENSIGFFKSTLK